MARTFASVELFLLGQLEKRSMWKSREQSTMVLKLENVLESPGRPVKTQIAGLHPRVSDSQGLESGLIICVCSKFTGDADAGSPGTRPQASTSTVMYNSGGGALQSVFIKASR